jgi:cell division protein FtsN
MIGPGVIPVRVVVKRLTPGDDADPASRMGQYTVQVGSFASEGSARSLEQSLAGSFPEVEVVRGTVRGEAYFRVRVGNFRRRSDAVALAERLAARGLSVLITERDP